MDEYDEIDWFEAQYADELGVLNELEGEEITSEIKNPVRRILKFGKSQTVSSKQLEENIELSDGGPIKLNDSSTKKRPAEDVIFQNSNSHSVKDLVEYGAKLTDSTEPAVKRKRLDVMTDDFIDSSAFEDMNNGKPFEIHKPVLSSSKNQVHRRIPNGNFLPVTSQDGVRAYLKLHPKKDCISEVIKKYSSKSASRMLSQPYHELYAEVQEQRLNSIHRNMNGISEEKMEISHSQKLWVEEYRPQNYIHLLSDDGTNRTLLQWLKLWDKAVFNKEKRIRTKANQSFDAKMPASSHRMESKFKKFGNKYLPEITQDLDQNNRPMQKVALLCGAPGLGKTTLAHVIANHAGYNVVEMNASDDRSIDVFRTQIEAATQMKSVLGKDPRPNCLVIDEIDGAPANSINLLIQFTKNTGAITGKRKKKSRFILNRPIICICNDQFVPALRPLRAISLVINFPPTISTRLAMRLLEVARIEKMIADVSMLYALCEKTNNDIRSCLSTLQFIKAKKKKLTMADILSSSIGQKDEHRSLFAVWQEIFTVPRQQRKSFINPHDRSNLKKVPSATSKVQDEVSTKALPARSANLLKQCSSCGETPRLIHGMFENYLLMKAKDTLMKKVSNGAEWMCYSDVVNQEIMHSQNYVLMPYLPYTCVAFHFMFSLLNPPRLNYPTMDNEHKNNHTKMVNMTKAMYSEMPSHVRSFLNDRTLVQDVLPFLIDIIQPPLRPINTQLYSNREKQELHRLISIMISCNLTYRQERTEDGQFIFVLDPNVEELTKFPDIKSHNSLSYTLRQLVAREIELEKMRRSEPNLTKAVEEGAKGPAEAKTSLEVVPNHKQVLKPKSFTETEVKPELDFFGRVLQHKKAANVAGDNSATSDNTDENGVWFKFKEGYNNAVRTKVRLQDLM